jgi:hypothetical protein
MVGQKCPMQIAKARRLDLVEGGEDTRRLPQGDDVVGD